MSSVPPPPRVAAPSPRSQRLPLPAKLAYPLALLSGFFYFIAFPGIEFWPLAFIALVPLLIALRGQTPRRGFWLGWLAGLTMTMCGFYWLLEMLEVFSGFPLPLCFLFMTLLCAYQAGRIGLMGWLSVRLERKGWPPGLGFALAFAASEQIFPLLFPWFFAGTVHQVPHLIQGAELGGPILVGLVLVVGNLLCGEPLLARLEHRKPRFKLMGIWAGLLVLNLGYGAVRIHGVDSDVARAPKARVGLVQANMSLLGKRQDPNEGLHRHLKLTRSLTQARPHDLVVWSETSVGGAVSEDQMDRIYKHRVGRRLAGTPAIFGAVLVRPVSDARGYTLSNSALATNRKGDVTGRFDKQVLLAFGEYLPFGETFPVLYEWSPHSGRFMPGKSFEPLTIEGRDIATFICYEDIIPSFVNRIMKNGDPELLVNLTNDAWFGDTTEPWIHLALSKFRAIEQRRFFVRSTNSGVSAFVDPVGRVISHTETFEEAALSAELRWLKGATPYQLWGDQPWWLLAAVTLTGAFVARRRRAGAAVSPTLAPDSPAKGEADAVPSPAGSTAAPPATPDVPTPSPEPSSEAPHSTPPQPPTNEFGSFPEPGKDT